VGGGGFVKPAGSNTGVGGNKGTALGGGGFVNPKTNAGGSRGSYGSNSYGGGSYGRYGGTSSYGGAGYNYRSPGYGTNYGTNFGSGVGRYPGAGGGYSKKALGLGVGAGFLGGAALGVAGTAAMYGVYHRYHQYRMMSMMVGGGYGGYNQGYYNNYYSNNQCFGGCPPGAHCEWGFCECNRGLEKRFGRCERDWSNMAARGADFDWNRACRDSNECQRLDVNLICNTNTTVQQGGNCECRQDMKWNTKAGECQLFLDVDCSSVTYDTKPDPVILEAVNKTLEKVAEANKTQEEVGEENANSTSTPAEALSNSLLSSIDVNKDDVSQAQLKEAYCRDVDSFSWEFGAPKNQQQQQGRDWNGNRTRTAVGVGSGTIVLIVLLLCGTCCTCGICLALKKKRSKSSEPPVTFSDVHVNDAGMGMGGVTANPGYKAESTPQHQGGAPGYPGATFSNTGVLYPGPAAIPPTQPGYTNFPGSEGQGNPSPYPPQPAAYPPQAAAYPPQGAAYPPQGAAYPPQNAAYPPAADQSAGGLPYPPQPSQPAYNPY